MRSGRIKSRINDMTDASELERLSGGGIRKVSGSSRLEVYNHNRRARGGPGWRKADSKADAWDRWVRPDHGNSLPPPPLPLPSAAEDCEREKGVLQLRIAETAHLRTERMAKVRMLAKLGVAKEIERAEAAAVAEFEESLSSPSGRSPSAPPSRPLPSPPAAVSPPQQWVTPVGDESADEEATAPTPGPSSIGPTQLEVEQSLSTPSGSPGRSPSAPPSRPLPSPPAAVSPPQWVTPVPVGDESADEQPGVKPQPQPRAAAVVSLQAAQRRWLARRELARLRAEAAATAAAAAEAAEAAATTAVAAVALQAAQRRRLARRELARLRAEAAATAAAAARQRRGRQAGAEFTPCHLTIVVGCVSALLLIMMLSSLAWLPGGIGSMGPLSYSGGSSFNMFGPATSWQVELTRWVCMWGTSMLLVAGAWFLRAPLSELLVPWFGIAPLVPLERVNEVVTV